MREPSGPGRILEFVRDNPPAAPSSGPSYPSRVAGPLLACLVVTAVFGRQLLSNARIPSPSSYAEAVLGSNAYAMRNAPDLEIPGSLADVVTTWQLIAYSTVTAAADRHESLVGLTREFVLVVTMLTLLLIIVTCRRLLLGWISTVLAVLLIGLPATFALARLVSTSAALAALWLIISVLLLIVVANRRGSRDEESAVAQPAGMMRRTRLLILLSGATALIAVLTAPVSILIVLGLALGFVNMRRTDHGWTDKARILAIVVLSAALVLALWLTVWEPATAESGLPSLEVSGRAIALGGLVVAAACWSIGWLRPLAIASAPILLAAGWPGPAAAQALTLGLCFSALLVAGLVDTALRREPSGTATRRFFAIRAGATATLLLATIAGGLLVPASSVAAVTVTPGVEVARWIDSQLPADAVVQVDPLNRVQLVRDGLDPDRLTTAGQSGPDPDFLLVPLQRHTDLPLIAGFGSGSDALAIRQVVTDPRAYAEAEVADREARSRFGDALADNPNLSLSESAAAAMRAGDVDSRLMVSLAAASTSVRLAITGFPTTDGDLGRANVFRAAILTDITDLDPSVGAQGTSPEALRWLAQFFATQQPPYLPLRVTEAVMSLHVVYAAPPPLGLLPTCPPMEIPCP